MRTHKTVGKKLALAFLAMIATSSVWTAVSFAAAPSPDEALATLKEGNARFAAGQSAHPRADSSRIVDTAQNGQHPSATVLTCSDSRVPVEHVFDQGIGDVFVIRVAGNVCDTDEIGSIEYGVDHLGTPLLVVLGHTKCGAVTAVTTNAVLHGNIPPLVDNIGPAVAKARAANPTLQGEALVPEAIKANCWQAIDDLFKSSPATRDKVKSGAVKVVAAVYDVANGRVEWLGAHPEQGRLLAYTGGPSQGNGQHASPAAASSSSPATAGSHGEPQAAAVSHGGSSAHSETAVLAEKVTLIDPTKLQELDKARNRKVEVAAASLASAEGGMNILWKIGLAFVVVVVVVGAVFQTGIFARMGISGKLYTGFGALVVLAVAIGLGGFYFMRSMNAQANLEGTTLEMDAMANEIGTLQNEVLVYGTENKQRAQELTQEITTKVEEFKKDIAGLRESKLDAAALSAVADLEKNLNKFKDSFTSFSEKLTRVIEGKAKLTEVGDKAEKKLADVIARHKSELAQLKQTGSNLATLGVQTELIEKLDDCELLYTKVAGDEAEFLLSKRVESVAAMEQELGLLYGTLTAVKGLISEAAADKAEETKDLGMAADTVESIREYAKVLAQIVESDLTVEADAIDTASDLKAMEAMTSAMAKRMGQQADRMSAQANTTSIALVILALVLGSVLAFAIARAIVKPINRIIASLNEGSEQVSSASSQVSSASQSLAEGATEQAAGLEETSSSLEEMSSMTKQNADNAQQANTLAAEARKAAGTGSESMSRMDAAIREIQKSSDETAKIIKVIDEIAFQTNLLALNAAVEAARAGEAGKGFAVVAEEVRNLAMRSAEAAKNTARMIEESVKNSKNGVDIATEVGKVLEEIVQSVGKTTDLVSEIAAASQEQAQGIDQVNTAVAQMDKVTQQNAANAEESASASEELNAQAESMKEVVSQLIALVGGAGSKAAESGGPKKTEHHLQVNLEHKSPKIEKAASKSHGFGKSDEAFHKIAARPEAKHAPKAKSAGKVIPLDSGEHDLESFNN
jgi:carbonic anhydrase/ABC-type transporter Mla subunit MlaD